MNIYKALSVSLATVSLMLASAAPFAAGQVHVLTPDSSIENPKDIGSKVHTHLKILEQPGGQANFNDKINQQITPSATAPIVGRGYQTPSSIACIYGLPTAQQISGCNPNLTSTPVAGNAAGSKAIAIVDAYNYPNAQKDLAYFSSYFGLPAPNLSIVYASGSKPSNSPNNWELEAALDLQWAHALAPSAKLILVEAASNSTSDLLKAVQVATSQVLAAGGGAVSMSWGSSEFSGETSNDKYFNNPGVVYFASSGDSAGTSWPCVSQNVICVGGTTLRVNNNTSNNTLIGDFLQEVAWENGGGGISSYVTTPAYQTGSMRTVPDVALAADPNAGGYVVYSPSNSGSTYWYVVGGTSWSSPMAAGITANAGTIVPLVSTSLMELTNIYNGTYVNFFKDIQGGWCGFYAGLSSGFGWDYCTGVGSYKGY